MLTRVYTATTIGLDPIKIEVEVDGVRGQPNLIIIGLPSKSVEESRERITAALIHCGYPPKAKRTIVNLAPADLKKQGSTFELAIAVGMLSLQGLVRMSLESIMFFGELSLNGEIKTIKGALPLVLAAKKMGFSVAIIPQGNRNEVSLVQDITIYTVKHLSEIIDFLSTKKALPRLKTTTHIPPTRLDSATSFADIFGQEQAKRALLIAAAGGHNVLLIGPPGSGKSMMAKALQSIMPPLTLHEALEITSIYSISGKTNGSLITSRPFRAPHHTTSEVGLIGGSNVLKPGEISLAHNGILFLDEFPEFSRSSLEALRQPLEDGVVTLSRAVGSATYPSRFTLIAAANPCPCGWYDSRQHKCTCSPYFISLYQKKISGPILDRIDIHLHIRAVPPEQLAQTNKTSSDSDKSFKELILTARERQISRYKSISATRLNAHLTSKEIRNSCILSNEAQTLLHTANASLNLSARSYFKIIKVAQTIADLSAAERIESNFIAEALQYRRFEH